MELRPAGGWPAGHCEACGLCSVAHCLRTVARAARGPVCTTGPRRHDSTGRRARSKLCSTSAWFRAGGPPRTGSGSSPLGCVRVYQDLRLTRRLVAISRTWALPKKKIDCDQLPIARSATQPPATRQRRPPATRQRRPPVCSRLPTAQQRRPAAQPPATQQRRPAAQPPATQQRRPAAQPPATQQRNRLGNAPWYCLRHQYSRGASSRRPSRQPSVRRFRCRRRAPRAARPRFRASRPPTKRRMTCNVTWKWPPSPPMQASSGTLGNSGA